MEIKLLNFIEREREREMQRERESWKEARRETRGNILCCSLLDSNDLWEAEGSLSLAAGSPYKLGAQAFNLILDHSNKIDTIYATANGLICYRNPRRGRTPFRHQER